MLPGFVALALAGGSAKAENQAPTFLLPPGEVQQAGERWTSGTSERTWKDIACSANGEKVVAIVEGVGEEQNATRIITSADGGETWVEGPLAPNWNAVASSANGSILYAVNFWGQIHVSTDSGSNWNAYGDSRGWWCVACSADGSKAVAGGAGGGLYVSSDSGQTWTGDSQELDSLWKAVTCSADGSKLAAVGIFNNIYSSQDFGGTWTASGPSLDWTDIVSSADGSKLAATAIDSTIHLSSDAGETWEQSTSLSAQWSSIACSADGTHLAALHRAIGGGEIFPPFGNFDESMTNTVSISIDSGLTWTDHTIDSSVPSWIDWRALCSSSEGNRLIAVPSAGSAYVSEFSDVLVVSANEQVGSFLAEGFVTEITPGPENESGQTIQFILSYDHAELFEVVPSISPTGSLSFTSAVNAVGRSTVTVVAQDNGGTEDNGDDTSDSQTFVIEIYSNRAPSGIELWATEFYEHNETNALVGHLHVTDMDNENESGPYDQHTLSLESGEGDDDNESFLIENGQVRIIPVTDYETKSVYRFRVRATDSHGAIYEQALELQIKRVNKEPVFTLPSGEVPGTPGQVWTQRTASGYRSWSAIATSADGTHVVATVRGGAIHTSTDSGQTWFNRGMVGDWNGVACSSDGTKLVAVAGSDQQAGQIYTSTDAGATWVARDVPRHWYCVASSTDGNRLVAGVVNGMIYTSEDAGETWIPRDEERIWITVASSADGSKLVAGTATITGGNLYTSTDSGATWQERGPFGYWSTVTSSADGTHLAAAGFQQGMYASTDSGLTWTKKSDLPFTLLCGSADGSILTGISERRVHTSRDYGTTWTPRQVIGNWFLLAMSADGSKQYAAHHEGYIYTSDASPARVIDVAGITPYLQEEYATNVLPAASGELEQTVVLEVSNDHPEYFSVQPTISSTGVLSFTPRGFASGVVYVSVVARDNGGIANGGVDQSAPQIIVIKLTSILDQWREDNFGTNAAGSGDGDDADNDGIPNLLEFAFGTDPNDNSSGSTSLIYTGTFVGNGEITQAGQPMAKIEGAAAGIDFRALFVRRADHQDAGLTYTVQFSADLETWQSSTAFPTVLAEDGGLQIVGVRYPRFVGGKKARFFRVKVSIAEASSNP